MTTDTPTASPPEVKQSPLRIVLFGVPKAGKTSLLAALGQIQKENPDLLQGELIDKQQGLERERELVYEQGAPRTEEEVLPVPIEFKPVAKKGQRRRESYPVEANLIDCDGHIAAEILVGRRQLRGRKVKGGLGPTLWDADTLVLVLDAAAKEDHMEKVFKAFGKFLRDLEVRRGEATAVTDLPVFLVLTKCDLLAQEGDDYQEWINRMEDRKAEVMQRFREFIAHEKLNRPTAFGRLDLQPWTTAIYRPALGKKAANKKNPYGVAELFWQCLRSSFDFRLRRKQSGRRLLWTMGSSSGLAILLGALLLLLMGGLGVTRPDTLQFEVEQFQADEIRFPHRLHVNLPGIKSRQQRLNQFRDHPGFDDLPERLKEFVVQRKQEVDTYLPFLSAVLDNRTPTVAKNDRELKERMDALNNPPLALPHENWEKTGAGLLRQQQLDDLNLLRERVDQLEEWLQRQRKRAIDLWKIPDNYRTGPLIKWRIWQPEVQEFVDTIADPLPATTNLPFASMVTGYSIRSFERIEGLYQSFELARKQLRSLLEISYVLGLDSAAEKPAPLVIPRTFKLTDAQKHLDQLEKTYPNYRDYLTLNNVPDVAWDSVRHEAEGSYRQLLRPAQARIKQQFEQSNNSWNKVGVWLKDTPDEFLAWQHLAMALKQLLATNPINPLTDAAQFLEKKSFTVTIEHAVIKTSLLDDPQPREGAHLIIHHNDNNYLLKPLGRRVQNSEAELTFEAIPKLVFTFTPGEKVSASINVRGTNQRLTWVGSRTRAYTIEALYQSPRLHRSNQRPEQGSRTKVSLILTPVQGIPRIPDLLPTTSNGS